MQRQRGRLCWCGQSGGCAGGGKGPRHSGWTAGSRELLAGLGKLQRVHMAAQFVPEQRERC